MASVDNPRVVAMRANGDLSAKQYYLLKQDTAQDDVALVEANGIVIGVLANEPEDNEIADVWSLSGNTILKCVTDGTISVGEQMVSDANGKATTMAAATKQNVFGVSLDAGASDGAIVRFFPCAQQIDNS
jgi:hypothetical protein